MMKTLKLFLLLIFSSNIYSFELNDYSITSGIGSNYNFYYSDFKELKGYPSCCSNFDFANGIAYYFYLGLDKQVNLFGIKSEKIGLTLNYNNFSAKYNINEYIGNDIQENSYRKIYVDYILDVNYSVLGLYPYYQFQLPENIFPLNFKIGINLAIPIQKTFNQKEVLVSPEDLNFKNGSKINYEYSGDLPEINSIIISPEIILAYKFFQKDNLTLNAEIGFYAGLLPIIKGYSWNNYAIKGGINLTYNFPEPKPVREKIIPLPEPKLPHEIAKLNPPVLELKVLDNNKEYKNNDTITATFEIYKYHYFISNLPILFFEKDNIEPKNSLLINNLDENNLNFFEILKTNDFSSNYPQIIKEFIDRENLKFDIIAYTSDEDTKILENRVNNILYRLNDAGINTSNTNVITKKVNLGKENRKELIDEQRRIEFRFSNKKEIITNKITKEKVDYRFNKSLAIIPLVKSEDNDIKFNGYTTFNNLDKNFIDLKTNDILLSASLFETKNNKPNNLYIYAEVIDSQNQKTTAGFNIFLNNTKHLKEEFYNLTNQDNSILILGYFNFDETNFSIIDNNVLYYLKDKIKNNSFQIEIVPSTDNLGNPQYNQDLAVRRAKSAINLLNLNFNNLPKNVKISYPEKEFFNNDSPYGRAMNRSVIINISKIK